MHELYIKNVKIIDGSGAPAFFGNVHVTDGKVYLTDTVPEKITAETVTDGTGLTLCPGFIDSHAHSDLCIGADPNIAYIGKISQGVTTEVCGQCGFSLFPVSRTDFAVSEEVLGGFISDRIRKVLPEFVSMEAFSDYAKKAAKVTNYTFLVGHCMLRSTVMGVADRKPTADEFEEMKQLLKEAMEHGARGMSSGLVYIPGAYCDQSELIELCKVMAPYGGIYATHMRNEADDSIKSVADSIEVARQSGVALVISHHKICGKKNWGLSEKTLRLIENARKEGLSVHLDMYPYHATMTNLDNCIPPHYFSGGNAHLASLLSDPVSRMQIRKEMQIDPASYDNPYLNTGGFHKILISSAPSTPDAVGKTVQEYADMAGKNAFDAYFDLLSDNQFACMASFFSLSEEDMLAIYKSPYAMIGSDTICSEVRGPAHPRAYGSFIKPLADFALRRRLLTLEEAVHKQTGLTASVWKLEKKGLIRNGYDADLVLLDESKLQDMADFEDGTRIARGIVGVYVNGKLVYDGERITDARPGQCL